MSSFFLSLVIPSLEFFDPQRRYPIPTSKGKPFSWGVKYTGEFAIFDRNRRLSRNSKRPMVVMER